MTHTLAAVPLLLLPIVVDTRTLGSVEEAAVSERAVDWMAGDETLQTACTLSFAATELRAYLSRVANLPPDRFPLTPWDDTAVARPSW
jgi:hypothetical protein